ncbi:MAG: PKD domain-containing protein [Gammaproteobacteria bacterium]
MLVFRCRLPRHPVRKTTLATIFGTSLLMLLSGNAFSAKPLDPGGGGGGGGGGKDKAPTCTITQPAADPFQVNSGDPVDFAATAESGSAPYDVIWSLPGSDQTEVQDSIATSGGSSSVTVYYLADGTYTATFSATDSKGQSCSDSRSVEVGSAPPPPPPTAANYSILAVNDLGMHCADLDYQIFTILPPFNVIHAQVIEKGTGATAGTLPKLLSSSQVDVVYSATSSDLDPAGAGSINTTNDAALLGFDKTNFWEVADSNTLGGLAYRELYPSQDALGLCDATLGPCPSALDLFEPIAVDTGIPVPDPAHLCRASRTIRSSSTASTSTCRSSRACRSVTPSPTPTGSRPTASRSCRSTMPATRTPIH